MAAAPGSHSRPAALTNPLSRSHRGRTPRTPALRQVEQVLFESPKDFPGVPGFPVYPEQVSEARGLPALMGMRCCLRDVQPDEKVQFVLIRSFVFRPVLLADEPAVFLALQSGLHFVQQVKEAQRRREIRTYELLD